MDNYAILRYFVPCSVVRYKGSATQNNVNSKNKSFFGSAAKMTVKNKIMSEFSFQLGFSQVKQKDVEEVRNRIMTALGINTRSSWAARLNGAVEPKVSEAREIEAIFGDYGITDIWGEQE